jgi:hypothetical protein
LTQKLTLTVCPTPTGLGETLQKEYVGICHAGVCALISVIEAPIEIAMSIAIVIAAVLFLAIRIFLFSPKFYLNESVKLCSRSMALMPEFYL